MKHKFIGLLSVAFLMCASTTIAVHAENETTTVENPTTVIAVETTTPVAKTTTPAYVKSITVNKTIKVNKKASIKKDIKLNKTKLKNFTLVSNKTKVATISSSGKIKAKKAGKEKASSQARLQLMMQYIHKHFGEKISLEDIAEQAVVSKSTALNLFRRYLHKKKFSQERLWASSF